MIKIVIYNMFLSKCMALFASIYLLPADTNEFRLSMNMLNNSISLK